MTLSRYTVLFAYVPATSLRPVGVKATVLEGGPRTLFIGHTAAQID
jgi:hypothetical protein